MYTQIPEVFVDLMAVIGHLGCREEEVITLWSKFKPSSIIAVTVCNKNNQESLSYVCGYV